MGRKDQDTSIEAFHSESVKKLAVDIGLLICEQLRAQGPMTIREVTALIPMVATSISPRFASLEREGKIQKKQRRRCAISGKKAWEWEEGNFVPIPKPKKCCPHCNGEL